MIVCRGIHHRMPFQQMKFPLKPVFKLSSRNAIRNEAIGDLADEKHTANERQTLSSHLRTIPLPQSRPYQWEPN